MTEVQSFRVHLRSGVWEIRYTTTRLLGDDMGYGWWCFSEDGSQVAFCATEQLMIDALVYSRIRADQTGPK